MIFSILTRNFYKSLSPSVMPPGELKVFGKIKAKFGGGSAGHNGIESIDKFIGKDYSRVRIGIGHPKQKKKVNNHVLEDFKDDEEEKINVITGNIVKQLPTLIQKKIDLFSSKVNQDLNGI